MRKIKGSNSYLKNQTRVNLAKAVLCVLIFGILLFGIMFRSIYSMQIDLITEIGLVFLLAPIIASYYYLRKYHLYNGGRQGEKSVAKLLNSHLSDDYYLINDLYLGAGGDIDHIVLAPNGVFVLETKNWRGNITCDGDKWHRSGKRDFSSSPSIQVKRNASKIRRIIDSESSLRALGSWVEGIVVLTNRHATLHLNNPTVPILKLEQLTNYITTHNSMRRLSREQIEAIGKEITQRKA